MSISNLQEQRNKLMTDAASIIRSENPNADQLAQSDKMLSDASDLEAVMEFASK
jgi:hypothetical protein